MYCRIKIKTERKLRISKESNWNMKIIIIIYFYRKAFGVFYLKFFSYYYLLIHRTTNKQIVDGPRKPSIPQNNLALVLWSDQIEEGENLELNQIVTRRFPVSCVFYRKIKKKLPRSKNISCRAPPLYPPSIEVTVWKPQKLILCQKLLWNTLLPDLKIWHL